MKARRKRQFIHVKKEKKTSIAWNQIPNKNYLPEMKKKNQGNSQIKKEQITEINSEYMHTYACRWWQSMHPRGRAGGQRSMSEMLKTGSYKTGSGSHRHINYISLLSTGVTSGNYSLGYGNEKVR